jgi:predicted metal-binding membrane protein
MLLLFAAGVMNRLWVAIIARLVLLEKLAPGGPLFERLAGILMTVFGVGLMVANTI